VHYPLSRSTDHLLGEALLATLAVVLAPVAVTLAAISWGLPDPQVVVSAALGLALSCAAAAIGTSMWLRRPESLEVSFGELMLWRYLRRRHAERSIEAHSAELRAVPPISALTVVPGRRVDLLHRLSDALEAKDPYTHGHSRRVSRHAYRTAMCLNLPSHDIEDLRIAAALHDVGKIDLPDAILRKPGDLTEAELESVRRHPDIGADMVAAAAAPAVSEAIRFHHEAWDGSGYPHGLRGEEIPLFARIICVADAYDAMTSARPYRAGMGRAEAVAALRAGSGTQFDPNVVEAFIDALPAGLQAAGAFLMFAVPTQALRKVAAWSKAAGGGSLATAAGTTAFAVMIGGASLHPVPTQIEAPQPVTEAVVASDDPVEVTIRAPRAKTQVLGKQIVKNKKNLKKRSMTTQGGSTTTGGVQSPTHSGPKAPESQPEPKAEPKADAPAAPADPQPDKGDDCESSKQGSKGHELHCGG
jgi:HD-GYP domain-containing protein (c-di-GMP phosphodiesterase class II)